MNRLIQYFLLITLVAYLGASKAEQPLVQIFSEEPQQGSMIVGRMLAEGDVYFNDHKLPLTETGEFVFGVGRDASAEVKLQIHRGDQIKSHLLSIKQRQWKIERVDGLPAEKVNPRSKETLERIKRDNLKVGLARKITSEQNAFLMQFIRPAQGRISGVYGSQRVLNGQPKRPHFGLDIANKVGTTVIAPADGVITLAENDLFFSGGTIIIDHGFGINTTYLHLSRIQVQVGQAVSQGDVIGEMGATGRATGSHLDWRLNWFGNRLDPELLISD